MSDYSEAEFVAVEQVFLPSHLYICDFHREQAWERWTQDHKHGLNKEDGEKVLDLVRGQVQMRSYQWIITTSVH